MQPDDLLQNKCMFKYFRVKVLKISNLCLKDLGK